ncbi:MAG: DNA polymerase I, partial [Oscillospiraceae bacterium]|nr:DNA polymerase I [Oscillospiraceae bacterium]
MKLLVIDGNSILNRAFYGIKMLTTKDGRFTNGIYGFINILLKLLQELSPDAIAVAFDLKGPTFRHDMYEGYKAQRKGMPFELAQQLPVLKDVLEAFSYKILEAQGYEADDIIGTLSSACNDNDVCYIATGDRDSLQLVNKNVNVLLAATKMGKAVTTFYDEEKVKEEYSVAPNQLLDIKALMGDSSDNIPGVAGIGQKTACDLIAKFESIENIYNNIDSLDIKQGVKEKLINGKESAFLSKKLGKICKDVPVSTKISDYVPEQADKDKLRKIMSSLEMFKVMERLNIELISGYDDVGSKESKALPFENTSDYESVLSSLTKFGEAYFTIRFNGENIDAVYFCAKDKVVCVQNNDLSFMPFIKRFLEDAGIKKYTADSKALFRFCIDRDIDIKGVLMDVSLAGYILNPSANGYDIFRLAREYDTPGITVECDDELAKSAAQIMPLCKKLESLIDENGQKDLLLNIEIPLAQVLASMERLGFYVDKEGIIDFGNELEIKISEIEKSIFSKVGYELNLNSPK